MAFDRHAPAPLPVRDGLNPSRVRVPATESSTVTARTFLTAVIMGQRHRHPDDGPDAIMARFAAGLVVYADGRKVDPDDLLKPETDIWFYRMAAAEDPVPDDLSIVYADEHLTVINKPHFLATMPRGSHITQTAVVQARKLTGNDDLVPAHRLDRLTAGLLVFINKPDERGAYQKLFETGEVTKLYRAIATAPTEEEITTHPFPWTWLSHQHKERGILQAYTIADNEPNALTIVKTVNEMPAHKEKTLQEIFGTTEHLAQWILAPQTGRTHQLRLHMCEHGHPILGDPLYPTVRPDGPDDFKRPLLLQAQKLHFVDPFTGTKRSFSL